MQTPALEIISCLFTMGAGFLPPPGIVIGKLWKFELFLIVGIIVSLIAPYMIVTIYKKQSIQKIGNIADNLTEKALDKAMVVPALAEETEN